MNKKQSGFYLFFLFGLLHWGSSPAAILSLSPSSVNAVETNSFDVAVILSGLGDADVGAFEIAVGYDSPQLTATNVTFSGNLGTPGPETVIGTDLSTPGTVAFDELSLLPLLPSPPFPSLGDLQPGGSVQIATLSFIANSVGSASLGFDSWLISDAFGIEISIDQFVGAEVEISPIPLPGALWLMISGLLGIGALARKRGAGE